MYSDQQSDEPAIDNLEDEVVSQNSQDAEMRACMFIYTLCIKDIYLYSMLVCISIFLMLICICGFLHLVTKKITGDGLEYKMIIKNKASLEFPTLLL